MSWNNVTSVGIVNADRAVGDTDGLDTTFAPPDPKYNAVASVIPEIVNGT